MPAPLIGFDKERSCTAIGREIGAEVGDEVTGFLPAYWDMNARYAAVAPLLQYLYTKRQALDFLLGGVAQDVDWTEDASQKDSQLTDHYAALRQAVQSEIDQLQSRAAAMRPPAVGQLSAPQNSKYPACPNRNDPVYRGSPSRRDWFWGS